DDRSPAHPGHDRPALPYAPGGQPGHPTPASRHVAPQRRHPHAPRTPTTRAFYGPRNVSQPLVPHECDLSVLPCTIMLAMLSSVRAGWPVFTAVAVVGGERAMNITGHVGPGFERLRDAFAEGQKNDPGGAQLCVYRGGKEIASLATGRDTVRDQP